jgi:hypothetical protein
MAEVAEYMREKGEEKKWSNITVVLGEEEPAPAPAPEGGGGEGAAADGDSA